MPLPPPRSLSRHYNVGMAVPLALFDALWGQGFGPAAGLRPGADLPRIWRILSSTNRRPARREFFLLSELNLRLGCGE